MQMTFDEYIRNPMGRENAVISNREMYAKMYQGKLDKILVREAGHIDIKAYHVKNNYVCYIKIPSEIVPKFYYDTVIEFIPPKGITVDTTLKQYHVNFYSNDPSFVYTFAHAFIENDIFIKWLKDKMSKEAVKKVAKEKNPHNQVGYVKSLYFAYLIMSKRGYFSKTRYTDPYSENALKREIEDADKKIADREKEGKKLAEEKRKEKDKIKKVTSQDNNINPDIPIQPKSMRIGKISTVKKTNNLKSNIRKVGIIKRK